MYPKTKSSRALVEKAPIRCVPSRRYISQYPFGITPPIIHPLADGEPSSYQVSLFHTMYLYNVHYWISFLPLLLCWIETHSPFSLSCPSSSSSLFIQVKLDTAPYEPPFTADKKRTPAKLLAQGTFLRRQQCPIRPIIGGAPNTFFPYQIPGCKADNGRVQSADLTFRQRLLKIW